MPGDQYGIIVLGSGPGGGSLARRLAPTGKRILMLGRGEYLPRSRESRDAKTVFGDGRHQVDETWYGKDGRSFKPGLHYRVGGNSKVYGAVFRMREDLPLPKSRVSYREGKVVLNVEQTNQEAAIRLRVKHQGLPALMNAWPKLIDRDLCLGKGIPLSGTAHQAGTMRFGTDPATSVLDLDCKAHELDNLHVTDAGFFPSIGAADAIGKRMGG